MAVYNSIQLDLCKKNSYKAIPTKQLDTNSRFLRVELLNNGNPYDFNDDVTVILASTRDGETKAYKCTVEDGCVVAPLTSWMLAEEGYVDCEIVLIDTASNSKLSSFAFSICVDESIYNDETISQDENYNVLLKLITDVDTAVKSCNTATEKATEIYNTVETKLNNGELKGEKGDKGDPYELTISDIWKIVDNIPYASVKTAGILRVPGGCGLLVDKRGNADVYYNIPDLTSTTDDIIVEKQGGTLQGDGYCKLTFNGEKYAQKTEVPKKISELQNDSGYITADDAPPEVYIGSAEPQGNEVIWVDNSTNPENINATKAYVDEVVNLSKTRIVTDTENTVIPAFELAYNKEYRFTLELESIEFTLPELPKDDFISSLVFKSGATATTITYPDTIKWSGEDISSEKFVPASSKTYEVLIYWNGINYCGIVKGW